MYAIKQNLCTNIYRYVRIVIRIIGIYTDRGEMLCNIIGTKHILCVIVACEWGDYVLYEMYTGPISGK